MVKATFDPVSSFYPIMEQIVFGSALSQARRTFISRVRAGGARQLQLEVSDSYNSRFCGRL